MRRKDLSLSLSLGRRTRSAKVGSRGFTIVELMLVVVVIAILAAISIVAYTNVQERARDAAQDLASQQLRQGLDLYFLDHGSYPAVCFDENGELIIMGRPRS